ncbi:MAG: ATP synthase F0 subunit C [Bdellovibrionales bacterium]|nr:ATP synthase F0 subunit C [Bdellovibrionales bacterium]
MKLFTQATRWILALAPLFVAGTAMAAEGEAAASSGGLTAIAAALAIGLSAFGGALGQGKAAATALDGIARNPSAQPKILVPMIIGLALIESLVIYGLLIAMKLSGIF